MGVIILDNEVKQKLHRRINYDNMRALTISMVPKSLQFVIHAKSYGHDPMLECDQRNFIQEEIQKAYFLKSLNDQKELPLFTFEKWDDSLPIYFVNSKLDKFRTSK